MVVQQRFGKLTKHKPNRIHYFKRVKPLFLYIRGQKAREMVATEAFEEFRVFYLEARMYSRETIKGHQTVMKSFISCVGDVEIGDISPEHVGRWTANMHMRGNSPSTIVSHLSRFKVFVIFAIEAGWSSMKKDDVRVPKKPKTLPKYVTAEHVDRIVTMTPSLRDKAIVSFAFSTGSRNSEMRNMERRHVNGLNVTIIEGKGMRDRVTYMDSDAAHHLNAYLDSRNDTCPYLFITNRCERIAGSTFRHIFDLAGERAGLGKVSPHMFRHGAATHLMNNGMPSRYIQKFLGHSFLSTTEQYMHVSDMDLQTQHSRIMTARNHL